MIKAQWAMGDIECLKQRGETNNTSAAVCILADTSTARHPLDWPLPHERAHQDALWFCSGGDQLL